MKRKSILPKKATPCSLPTPKDYAWCYEKALEIMAKPDDDYRVVFNLTHITIKEGEISHTIEKGAWLRTRTSFGMWRILCKFNREDAAALNAQNIYWHLQETLNCGNV